MNNRGLCYESRRITNRLYEGKHPLAGNRGGLFGLAGTVIALETGSNTDREEALQLLEELAAALTCCGRCQAKLWIFAGLIAAQIDPLRGEACFERARQFAPPSAPPAPRSTRTRPRTATGRGYCFEERYAAVLDAIEHVRRIPLLAG